MRREKPVCAEGEGTVGTEACRAAGNRTSAQRKRTEPSGRLIYAKGSLYGATEAYLFPRELIGRPGKLMAGDIRGRRGPISLCEGT